VNELPIMSEVAHYSASRRCAMDGRNWSPRSCLTTFRCWKSSRTVDFPRAGNTTSKQYTCRFGCA